MYRVEWEPAASDEFAAIAMVHPDRWKDINAADNAIAKKLKQSPLKYSQPVAEGLRRIISAPLVVYSALTALRSTSNRLVGSNETARAIALPGGLLPNLSLPQRCARGPCLIFKEIGFVTRRANVVQAISSNHFRELMRKSR